LIVGLPGLRACDSARDEKESRHGAKNAVVNDSASDNVFHNDSPFKGSVPEHDLISKIFCRRAHHMVHVKARHLM
jgi:hypothetical protein